jgi:predicted phosphohydrolase
MKGNHDYWWQSIKKLREFTEREGFDTIQFLHNTAYELDEIIVAGSRGWATESSPSAEDKKIILREAIRFDISLTEAKKLKGEGDKEIVVFSHYPVLSPGEETSPILEVLVRHGVKRLYYGHLHGVNDSRLIKKAGGVELELVSADYRMFTPLRIK